MGDCQEMPDCLFDADVCQVKGCTTPNPDLRRYLTGNDDYQKVVRLCPFHAPPAAMDHLRPLSIGDYRELWKDRLQFEAHHGGARRDGYMTVDPSHPGAKILVQSWRDECKSKIELPAGAMGMDALHRYAQSPIVLFRAKSTFGHIAGSSGTVCWITYASELLSRAYQSAEGRKEVGYVEDKLMARLQQACPGADFDTGRRDVWTRAMKAPDADLLARSVVKYEQDLRNEDVRNVFLVDRL